MTRKEYLALWRLAHREERRAYMARWKEEHRQEQRAYLRDWRQRNLDRMRKKNAERMQARRSKAKRAFWERHGKRCAYCGRELLLEEATRDHVTPLANGGTDLEDNLALACFACNRDKSDRTPEEWDPARFPGPLFYPGNGNGNGGGDDEAASGDVPF